MNWPTVAQIAVTALLAISGWLAVHSLSAARDRRNRQRDLRVQYLIEAYRRLEGASNKRTDQKVTPAIESAIADIQLLGTGEQVALAREFAVGFAKEGTASVEPLLVSLRRDLRAELRLPQIREGITFLRVTYPDDKT